MSDLQLICGFERMLEIGFRRFDGTGNVAALREMGGDGC